MEKRDRGEGGVELGEARRERVMVGCGRRRMKKVHYWREAGPVAVAGGRFGLGSAPLRVYRGRDAAFPILGSFGLLLDFEGCHPMSFLLQTTWNQPSQVFNSSRNTNKCNIIFFFFFLRNHQ